MIPFTLILLLLQHSLSLGYANVPPQVSMERIWAEGSYPRGVFVGQKLLVCFGRVVSGMKELVVIDSMNTGIAGTVAVANASVDDLANCNLVLYQNHSSILLMASYRHHVGCNSTDCDMYTIRTRIGSIDGRSWGAEEIVRRSFPPQGLWEPFLFYRGGFGKVSRRLSIAYAHEFPKLPGAPGKEQEIAMQDYPWNTSPPRTLYHRNHSRDGMPGVAELRNGTLIAVFEGFWGEEWGQFTVNAVSSVDGGETWGGGVVVFAGNTSRKAGAPQVAATSDDTIIVSCMTNVYTPNPGPWVASATALSLSGPSYTSLSPTTFFGPPNSYWPGLVANTSAFHLQTPNHNTSTASSGVVGLVGNASGIFQTTHPLPTEQPS